MQKKINLFIIGASKCGTTSIWHMLKYHTNTYMLKTKEPCIFSFKNYLKRLNKFSYEINQHSKESYIGEASTIYSLTTIIPEIPMRIADYNPNAKIIYIVREPISRLKSVWRQTLSSGHWHQQVYKNYTDVEVPLMPKNFEKAIFKYPPYIETCKYWSHLNNYRKFFKDENILLLFFEDLKSDPKKTYHEICDFLAINPEEDETLFEKQNSSEGKKMLVNWYIKLRKNQYLYNTLKIIAKTVGLKAPTKSINYAVNISPYVENKIHSILKEEKEQILTFAQKPLNFWDK